MSRLHARRPLFWALVAAAALCAALIAYAAARPASSAVVSQDEVQITTTWPMSSVKLASNMTTGYSWRTAGKLNGKVLKLVGSTYAVPETTKPVVGRGGTETWTFQALAKGSAKVTLEYVRPWEKGTKPARSQTFSVTVQ
jgi:predicted secreted protein